MSKFAALLFVLTSAGVGAFQIALILGTPWGEFTLGGRWSDQLPTKVRFIPVLSLLLLVGLSAIILAHAGFDIPFVQQQPHFLAWVVVGYCALGSVLNAVTPSKRERHLWLPVVLCMLALSLVVATF
jgi:hypothetical protein